VLYGISCYTIHVVQPEIGGLSIRFTSGVDPCPAPTPIDSGQPVCSREKGKGGQRKEKALFFKMA